VKEHYWQIPLGQMEKSAMENHNFNSENTKILSTNPDTWTIIPKR
jgi:hypothetical protein